MLRFLALLSCLASCLLFTQSAGAHPCHSLVELIGTLAPEEVSFGFDIDRNFLHLKTKTVLFNKKARQEILVDEEDAIQWLQQSDWVIEDTVSDRKSGSYKRYFSGQSGRNYFAEDLEEVLNRPASEWQGPMWEQFVYAMRNPQSAARTTLITARGHTREEIYDGLLVLKKRGYIQNVPPLDNIYAVMAKPGLHWSDIPGAKAKVIQRILNKVSTKKWIYSDDDPDNIAQIKALFDQKKSKNWKPLTLQLLYTGIDGLYPQRSMTWSAGSENQEGVNAR